MKKNLFKLLFVIVICLLLTGCKEDEEKKLITNQALDYFSSKYNIDKKDITITSNELYGSQTKCLDGCGENRLSINYKDTSVVIEYHNGFSDNYEIAKIKEDYIKYVKDNIIPVTNITLGETDDHLSFNKKYDGNIKEFLKGIDDDLYIVVYLECSTPEEALLFWRTYSTQLVTSLEDLDVSYNLFFSKAEGETKPVVYFSYDSSVKTNKFKYTNGITNEIVECEKDKLINATCRNR